VHTDWLGLNQVSLSSITATTNKKHHKGRGYCFEEENIDLIKIALVKNEIDKKTTT